MQSPQQIGPPADKHVKTMTITATFNEFEERNEPMLEAVVALCERIAHYSRSVFAYAECMGRLTILEHRLRRMVCDLNSPSWETLTASQICRLAEIAQPVYDKTLELTLLLTSCGFKTRMGFAYFTNNLEAVNVELLSRLSYLQGRLPLAPDMAWTASELRIVRELISSAPAAPTDDLRRIMKS